MARADLRDQGLAKQDIVLGVAASGRTPYGFGVPGYARSVGAPTIALARNPLSTIWVSPTLPSSRFPAPRRSNCSTRLKAGTTQKMVLNILSTGVMVRLGKVYSNLMVDVKPTNSKLRRRAIRIIGEVAAPGRCSCRTAPGFR